MHIKGSNLIIFNTLTSYARILVSVGLGLYTSRWILESLGDSDYGLFSVVGCLIVFVLFIGDALSSSAYRFFAYSIGQNQPDEIQKWFNCSFAIQCIFSVLLIIIGLPIGLYFISRILNIPEGRLGISYLLFFCSIAGTVVTVLAVPSVGLLLAKQRIFEQNMWRGLHTILCACLACSLLFTSGDNLLFYAIFIMLIKMSIDISQIIRVRILFPEIKLRHNYLFDKDRYIKFLSFSVWNLIGCFAEIFKNQGTVFLINIYSGSKTNAAYGLANQVSMQTNSISSAMLQAISPEIIRREGSGERDSMILLSLRTCKFAVFLTVLWFVPLYSELDYVLSLWLRNVPEYTGDFCRIILVLYAIDKLSVGYGSTIFAHGKIASYQLIHGVISIISFPIIWILFELGATPPIAISAILYTGILNMFFRVIWVKYLLKPPISVWLKKVFFPSIMVFGIPYLFAYLISLLYNPSFARFTCTTLISIIITLLSFWYFGLSQLEKKMFVEKFKNTKKKLATSFLRNE